MGAGVNVLGTLVDGVGGCKGRRGLIVDMDRCRLKSPLRDHGTEDVAQPKNLLGSSAGRNVLGFHRPLGSTRLLGTPPVNRLVVVGDEQAGGGFEIMVIASVVRVRVTP
ncbi:hypothetical protein HDV00_010924 [Rhizophlyctis rosea]|nr:hypothetical protein HDV00_010924 [Rhizophlyctis rosea]